MSVGDQGADFDTRNPYEAISPDNSGLYYRSRVFPGLAQSVDACRSGEVPYSELSLDAFQSWVELGWKKPHASAEAAERFMAKALEEYREVDEALEDYWETRNPGHLLEELGDFQWCIGANACNSGVVLGDDIKLRLYEYAVGTKVRTADGSFDYADWYGHAASLSVKRTSPTIGDIDDLISRGFVPQMSPAMNLYDEEEISPTVFMSDFLLYLAVLRNASEHLYQSGRPSLQSSSLRSFNRDIGALTSEVMLRTAAIASYVGSSLAHVVQVNIDKVSDRVEKNLVDKTDGSRT